MCGKGLNGIKANYRTTESVEQDQTAHLYRLILLYTQPQKTALVEVPLTETNDRTTESVEPDQAARMCSLILLYTLRKINSCSGTAKLNV